MITYYMVTAKDGGSCKGCHKPLSTEEFGAHEVETTEPDKDERIEGYYCSTACINAVREGVDNV